MKTIIDKFMGVRVQIDNIEIYKSEFCEIIKDFNLMLSCDSKYLKNALYKDVQYNIQSLCHRYPSILQNRERKFLRVKRNKVV